MTLALFQNQTLPARRPSEDARQYAYRIIRKFILELHLLPGQKMNEADLASSLNMSRTPIHDSFFKLSRENLVDVIPKRGAFVSKIDQKRMDSSKAGKRHDPFHLYKKGSQIRAGASVLSHPADEQLYA